MASINPATELSIDGEVATVTIDSPPVNALSQVVRDGLKRGVEAAEADEAVKAIVILCAGRTFIAGADISEFGKPQAPPFPPDVLDRIENASKPVVAALHGTALGGGFEVALTAHYRIAVPSAKCGLPEIKLGLIPGAGGTQRLPRLIGVEQALDVILSGTPFSAREAKDWGVVDELAEEGKLKEQAVAFARRLVAEKAPLKKVRDRFEKLEPARGHPEIFEAIRKANARKFRGFEAWLKAIQSVKNAVDLPFDEGIIKEREMFMALLATTQSKAQRHVFFAERQTAKIADIGPEIPTKPIKSVGVIGAGTMGGGIAMNFLSAGLPVTIVETAKEALDRGVATMRRNYENTARKGRLTMAEVEERMGRLTPTLDFGALSEADLVIEAVFENMDLKKSVFERLDGVAKEGAILASNTSYLDIDEIAAKTNRPEDVLGMHFFSPANVMRLLEIMRGAKTSKSTLATIAGLAPKIGKIGVVVGVCDGFVANRMLAAAPARGDETHPRRREPLGRRSRAGRFRHANGAVRDERSRRPRHRLVGRDVEALDHPRNLVRGGPARPEDRHRLLRLRRGAQRQTVGACRKTHPRFRRLEARRAALDFGPGDSRALHLSDDQRGRENSRGGQGAAGLRHRHHLDLRLRLAGLPRRPDVLRRHGRAEKCARQTARVRGEVRRGLQARAAVGEARRRGRRVFALVKVTRCPHPAASPPPSPASGRRARTPSPARGRGPG